MSVASAGLHIALAFDERFWAPAYATMRGICLSTRRRADLVFHLCHPALSETVLGDLARIGTEFGATLVHHDIESNPDYAYFAKSLPHTRYISEVMYARLFFDRIVGAGITRLAYIDSDILVRWPIEQFLEQGLEGRALGAIKEPHALVCSNRRDGNQDRDLFDPADPYFNSGVLLIDLERWRDMDIAARLYQLEKEGVLERLYNDQQILNYLFQNNWTQLDRGWNTLAASPAIEGLDPKAVHYTGLVKPWNLIAILPFRRIYRHVMTNEFYYRYMRQRWGWYWQRIGRRLTGRR